MVEHTPEAFLVSIEVRICKQQQMALILCQNKNRRKQNRLYEKKNYTLYKNVNVVFEINMWK